MQNTIHEEKVNKKYKGKKGTFLRHFGITLAVIVLLFTLFAASYVFDSIKRDQNFVMKFFSKSIKSDKTVSVNYQSDKKTLGNISSIPVFCFIPEKSISYTVTLSHIKSDDGMELMMNVIDSELTNYISADTISSKKKKDSFDGGHEDVLSGSGILNKGEKYYIVVEPVNTSEREYYTGSFEITVKRTPEAEEPEVIKVGETIEINIDPEETTSIIFRPEENGYYRFESTIKGMRAMTGSSGISSVLTDSGNEVEMFGGISYLKAGNEYYIVVNTDESIKKRVRADVSCTNVEHMVQEGYGMVEINAPTLIEYVSRAREIPAVWSESEGDPQSVVFDMQGIPLSNDNDSGGVFSRNDKDFALIFQAEKHKRYRIFVNGEFDVCNVNIGKYIGDGTRLGPDDVFFDINDKQQAEQSESQNEFKGEQSEPQNEQHENNNEQSDT